MYNKNKKRLPIVESNLETQKKIVIDFRSKEIGTKQTSGTCHKPSWIRFWRKGWCWGGYESYALFNFEMEHSYY